MKKRGRPFVKDLIKLSDIPPVLMRLIGVTRKRDTIYMWATKGVINSHGKRIKLKAYKRLGAWYTTENMLREFLLEMG